MLNLKQLAQLVDVAPQTIANWERKGWIAQPTPIGKPRWYNRNQVLTILVQTASPAILEEAQIVRKADLEKAVTR